MDYFNPSLTLLTRDPDVPSPFAEVLHPDTGEAVSVSEISAYDAATQINHIRWHWRFAGGRETVSDLPMWVYFPQELGALLSCAGFTAEEEYGDYDLSPFTSASQKHLIVARAA